METNFEEVSIVNPSFSALGYIVAVANLVEKHDRSTPSDFHWKILKCRMVIFSHSTILACPDEKEVKQIHLIFNKNGNDYDKLNTLFIRYSLQQEGKVREVTDKIYSQCFRYTMLAKMAPAWNIIGPNYLIHNRNFLTITGPQDGLQYSFICSGGRMIITLKAIKLTIIRPKYEMHSGELVRVFPSLNNAMVEDFSKILPNDAKFKCYKDLKRHWKNVHGYRLPEEECPYYSLRFWRGDSLIYPQICVTSQMPIVVPVSKSSGNLTIHRFIDDLRNKICNTLGTRVQLSHSCYNNFNQTKDNKPMDDTQTISLCTPTQATQNFKLYMNKNGA